MAIRFRCDCGIKLKAKEQMAGKSIRCPACGDEVEIPRLGEDPDAYSIQGTAPGEEGWASPAPEKIVAGRPTNWKPKSTFRPTVVSDTPALPTTVQARKKTGYQASKSAAVSWAQSLVFPVRGENIFSFIGWSIGFTFVTVMMVLPVFGLIMNAMRLVIFLIAVSYFFHFLSETIRSAAAGDEGLPETDSGEDVFFDAVNWGGTLIFGFAPWWGFLFLNWKFGWEAPAAIGRLLLIFSILYTPMGLLATSLFNTMLASNPVYVFGAIMKVPLQYFASCFLMVSVFFTYIVLNLLLPNILLVTDVIVSLLFLYTSIVLMHLLGSIYYRNRRKIGWFRES